MKFAIIKSSFNLQVTEGLYQGAIDFFQENGITKDQIDLFEAPGAFEMPLLAKKIAKKKKYDGIVCLGCVIKGETAHFEFISLGVSFGIMQVMLKTEIPVSFGVLTVYSEDQAAKRSEPNEDNKGREAARACLELALTLSKVN